MHGGGAVIGYSVMVWMEFAQLHCGENAYRRAFGTFRRWRHGAGIAEGEPKRNHLPLNWDQWLRATIMIFELCAGFSFVGVQGALFFGAHSQALAHR